MIGMQFSAMGAWLSSGAASSGKSRPQSGAICARHVGKLGNSIESDAVRSALDQADRFRMFEPTVPGDRFSRKAQFPPAPPNLDVEWQLVFDHIMISFRRV
jgi:hypothetical protein